MCQPLTNTERAFHDLGATATSALPEALVARDGPPVIVPDQRSYPRDLLAKEPIERREAARVQVAVDVNEGGRSDTLGPGERRCERVVEEATDDAGAAGPSRTLDELRWRSLCLGLVP